MGRRRRSKGSHLLNRRGILLLLGATVSGGALIETGAFSNVTADRVADASTANDPNAVFGIEGNADPAVVPTFTNTTGSSVTVTLDSAEDVEFDVNDDGTWELVPVTFGIGAGASVDVAIRSGGNTGDDADIDITATNNDFTFEATRNFRIPDSSAIENVVASVKASGGSGKYEFELENTGSTTVTLAEIGVTSTTSNTAVKVGGKNNDSIFLAAGTSVVDTVIQIGGSRQQFTTTVDLAPGPDNAISFEFDRFRTSQDKNAKMSGKEVTIDLALSDGSSTTIDLIP